MVFDVWIIRKKLTKIKFAFLFSTIYVYLFFSKDLNFKNNKLLKQTKIVVIVDLSRQQQNVIKGKYQGIFF